MSAKVFAVLGAVLTGGVIVNEVTNFPISLPQTVQMVIVGLGGLCLALFLVLDEME